MTRKQEYICRNTEFELVGVLSPIVPAAEVPLHAPTNDKSFNTGPQNLQYLPTIIGAIVRGTLNVHVADSSLTVAS